MLFVYLTQRFRSRPLKGQHLQISFLIPYPRSWSPLGTQGPFPLTPCFPTTLGPDFALHCRPTSCGILHSSARSYLRTRAGHCPLLLVLLLVLQEADAAAEAAGAMGAGEGPLLGCMDPPVALQPGSCPEGLATDAAAVAFGVRVGPAMVLKGKQVGQKFGTEGARIESGGVGLLVVQQAASMAI